MDSSTFFLCLLALFLWCQPTSEKLYTIGRLVQDFIYRSCDTTLLILGDGLYFFWETLCKIGGLLLGMVFYSLLKYYKAWRELKIEPQRPLKPLKQPRKKKSGHRAHRIPQQNAASSAQISILKDVFAVLKRLDNTTISLSDGQKSQDIKIEQLNAQITNINTHSYKKAHNTSSVESTPEEEAPKFKCSIFNTASPSPRPQRLSAALRKPLSDPVRYEAPAVEEAAEEMREIRPGSASENAAPAESLVQKQEVEQAIVDDNTLEPASPDAAAQKQEHEHEEKHDDNADMTPESTPVFGK